MVLLSSALAVFENHLKSHLYRQSCYGATMILCNGYGYCAEIVPKHISLDDWGFPIVSSSTIGDGAAPRRAGGRDLSATGVAARHSEPGCPLSTAAPRIHGPFRDSSTVEQAAVNRKVQGSNPCPGANFEFRNLVSRQAMLGCDTATVQPAGWITPAPAAEAATSSGGGPRLLEPGRPWRE